MLIEGFIEASITIDDIDTAARGARLRWFVASDPTRVEGLEAACRLYGSAGLSNRWSKRADEPGYATGLEP